VPRTSRRGPVAALAFAACPSRSRRTRACSPLSPRHRSARSTPAACGAGPSCRAGPAAMHTLAAAGTVMTSPAPPGMWRMIPGLGSRCASAATTTRPLSCSTPTRVICGAASPSTCPASSPASLGLRRRSCGRSCASATSKSLNIRHRASSTSTPSSAWTHPATTTSHPRPVHRRAAVRRHRPVRQHRHRHHRLGTPARLRCAN
jgi:hypothetical protein